MSSSGPPPGPPHEPHAGSSGPDDYDWLYEGHAAASAAPSASAGSSLPPPKLPPPGSARGDSTPKKPRKKGRWRLLWLLLVLWLAFLVIVPMVAWSKVTKVDATPAGDRPPEGSATTWLVVGTDKRPKDKSRGRTDTIMLLTYGGDGPSVLTSIPRDSQVDIPGVGRTKINAAYAYGGPPLLVETLESETGVHIDGYTEVGFQGLEKVVDALGGIELCPKENVKDKDAHLNIKAGCQEVDGKTALAYSRARHAYATGDIARGQNQREVIGAIGQAALKPMTVLNPFRYTSVSSATADSIAVGEDDSLFSFTRFAWNLARSMSGSGLNCTVPIADLAVTWDTERAIRYFKHLQNGTTDELGGLCTKDGLPK